VALVVACPRPARAQNYPRLALYGSVYGDGYPLIDTTGTLVPAALDQIARYDEVTLEASPITEYRPDAAAALRARHPGIRLLAYVHGHYAYFAAQSDSNVNYPTRYWRTVRNLNGFLYNQYGELFGSRTTQFADVNIAKRDGAGRYVVAEALAHLFYDAIVSTGVWDGLFIDTYCNNIEWMQAYGENIDYTRAGYSSLSAFSAGWKAGTDTLAARIRQLGGPNLILVGNCAQGTKYPWFNGWMREDFPNQNGGTWVANMYNDPGGYFVDEQRWIVPRHNFIFSASSGTNTPYTSDNTRRVRFGLGSAALASGYHVFGPSARQSRPQQYMSWWYDEYAVNRTTGNASTQLSDTGWLGQALGPYYQMVWVGAGPDGVSNSGFETSITSGWTLFTVIGSVASADTSSAPEGSTSIRITVPTAVPAVPYSTAFTTTGTLPITINGQYAATFWAKASYPRTLRVAAAHPTGGGESAAQVINIDDQWRRYQVVLIPWESGTATLAFHLAGMSGDVWLDDIHFKAGATSVYRRDFQNGIVLVNPSAGGQNVVLENTFRRITGSADPTINNGLSSSTQFVGPNDALFLIGSDHTPPAAIKDLHPAPAGTASARGQRPRDDR
jgi:hypothetical protein